MNFYSQRKEIILDFHSTLREMPMSSINSKTLLATYLLAMLSLRCALRLKATGNSVAAAKKFASRFFPARFSPSLSSSSGKDDYSGHQTGFDNEKFTVQDQELTEKMQQHQSTAARLSVAEEVRNLLHASNHHGVLSTNSLQFPGFPSGSVVAFELDEDGLPFFSLSTMSAHTKELVADNRASLVVMASDFKTVAEGRIAILGEISKFEGDESAIENLRDRYLQRHKNSYWIDFGDFSFFKMKRIETVRYVGGFARAGSVSEAEFLSAKVDPLVNFAAPVIKHMNEDHADSIVAMIQNYIGIPVTEAKMVGIDRLGMTIKAKLAFGDRGYSKIRLPFVREVTERKAVKDVIVEMARASSSP